MTGRAARMAPARFRLPETLKGANDMKGTNFATADFLLAAMLTAFALYALAILIARWAPVTRARNLVQRFVICILTVAGGFASFIAFLASFPMAMVQWQVGVPGTVVVAGCLVFGLSVVHSAAMRRSEVVWFCDLEEQVRLNGLRAKWRREGRELLGGDAIPTSPQAVARRPIAKRKRGQIFF
jgi:hypothetical protein